MTRDTRNFAIRPATAADVEAIHALIRELAVATGPTGKFRSTPEELLEHGFGPTPLFRAQVAASNDRISGVALYFDTFSSWRGEPGVYLQDLVVTGSARGLGLGTRLLQAVVSEASQRGATHMRLAVDIDNDKAMRFYVRNGMTKVDSDSVFEIDGDSFLNIGGSL